MERIKIRGGGLPLWPAVGALVLALLLALAQAAGAEPPLHLL